MNKKRKRSKKVTQKMVAAKAGISQTLVSMVLGGGKSSVEVADSTRRKIIETATELGYVFKNNISRKRVLALVMPPLTREDPAIEPWVYDIRDGFYAQTHLYVAECALRRGYSLIVRPYETGSDLTHWLSEWGVDGVIWHGPEGSLLRWVAERFPTVLLHYSNHPAVDCVTVNQEEIATMTLEHLYARGHRKILFAPGILSEPTQHMRVHAFEVRAAALGVDIYRDLFDAESYMGPDGLLDRILRLLDSEAPPMALIAGDPLVLLAAREARQRGLRIPQDLSLLGIDNIAMADICDPALSSVDVRQREVSEMAIALLIERLENREIPFRKLFLSPKLVSRASVWNRSGIAQDALSSGKARMGA